MTATLPRPILSRVFAMRHPEAAGTPRARFDAIRAWLAARGHDLALDSLATIIRGERERRTDLAFRRRLASIPGLTPDQRAWAVRMSQTPAQAFLLLERARRQAGPCQPHGALEIQLAQARQTISELATTLSTLASKLPA